MELKTLIHHAETRFADYKKLLEDVSRDKAVFPPDNETVAWYKALIREQKNQEQSWLKKLVEEKRFENEGMNPPFCYSLKKLEND